MKIISSYKKDEGRGRNNISNKGKENRKRKTVGFLSSKGYIYTLEVIIAIPIILLSLIFIFGTPPVKPELEISLIKQQGFNALEYLDQKDLLRQLSDAEIENQLRALLPDNIQLSLGGELPDKTVIAVDYYISGYKGKYIGKKITLWLWEEI